MMELWKQVNGEMVEVIRQQNDGNKPLLGKWKKVWGDWLVKEIG